MLPGARSKTESRSQPRAPASQRPGLFRNGRRRLLNGFPANGIWERPINTPGPPTQGGQIQGQDQPGGACVPLGLWQALRPLALWQRISPGPETKLYSRN
eukprot:10198093-Lingulodinium_polyedra.AAC.1